MAILDPSKGIVRVVFYGRGGQGIKTAGRILGRSLFTSGFNVQDFPIYGAERRGAPVYSYVITSSEELLERGPPESVDLTVIVDKSLLNLVNPEGVLLVNSVFPLENAMSVDMNSFIGKLGSYALSAAAASASAALINGIGRNEVIEAINKEVIANQYLLKKEVEIAVSVFDYVKKLPTPKTIGAKPKKDELVELSFDGPDISTPLILAKGTSTLRKTGAWRLVRPVVNLEACKACYLCYLACPEGVIKLNDESKPIISYDNCKGCMVCQEVCPFEAIKAKPESEVSLIE